MARPDGMRGDPQGPSRAPGGPPEGVLVLGMHRSGTSAATRLVNLLGPRTCGHGDLLGRAPWNPTGMWESRSLTRVNDVLLAQMGASWFHPPPSGDGYVRAAARVSIGSDEVRQAFDRAHPMPGPWVWKDPRTSLTLPFWRRALDRPVAAVVMFRSPVEVADSLLRRNSLPVGFGMALWERYNRLVMTHAAGLPLVVSSYEDLLDDPVGWSRFVGEFLAGLGMELGPDPDTATVASFVDRRLDHSRHRKGNGSTLVACPPSVTEMLEVLGRAAGTAPCFEPPPLATEPAWAAHELEVVGHAIEPAWNEPPGPVASP